MIGNTLRYLLLFLLPFILYGGWLLLARRRACGHENDPTWRDAPLIWLTSAGMVLVLVGFVAAAIFDGSDRDCPYVPSHIVDGRIVPGQVVCPPP